MWAKRKPGSARECEGIDLHTPKGTPTLGVGVLPNLHIVIAKVKTHHIE
jgi:hypothetical protein